MSPYLRYHIDSKCWSAQSWSKFIQTIERYQLANFSQDDIDLNRPLVVLCLNDEFQSVLKRFEHYQEVWFMCFNDSIDVVSPSGDNVFYFNKKELSEFEIVIQQFIDTFKHLYFLKLRDKVKKDFKKVHEESAKALEVFFGEQKFNFKSNSHSFDIQQLLEQLEELFLRLRTLHHHHSLQEAIGSVSFPGLDISLARLENDNVICESYEGALFLPLDGSSGHDILLFKSLNKIDIWDSFLIGLIYQGLSRFEYILARRNDDHEDNSLWEQAINVIEDPFALLSHAGDVLVHNPAFTRLKISPKACSLLQDGQKIEENHKLYRVSRVDLQEHHLDQVLLVFQSETDPTDVHHRKLTTNELGIVSGSLAHELNNPIAGILAAITVLQLDDHWTQEDLKSLKDMKESAKRCQHLIEIFLGFSKVNPINQDSLEIKNSFTQALSLLRFRMIEAALRIDLENYEEMGRFEKAINSSVMSMIFYLILSDILTNYSQLRLLESDNSKSSNIQVYLRETPQDIQINMKYRWSVEPNYELPKLLGHLLEIEGLTLEVEGYSIRLLRFGLL